MGKLADEVAAENAKVTKARVKCLGGLLSAAVKPEHREEYEQLMRTQHLATTAILRALTRADRRGKLIYLKAGFDVDSVTPKQFNRHRRGACTCDAI